MRSGILSHGSAALLGCVLLVLLFPAPARLEGLLSSDLDVPGAPPPGPQMQPAQPSLEAKEPASPEEDKGKSFVDVLQEKERTTLKTGPVPDKSFVDTLQEKERTTLQPKVIEDKSFVDVVREKERKTSSREPSQSQPAIDLEEHEEQAEAVRSGMGDRLEEEPSNPGQGDVFVDAVSQESNTIGQGPTVNTVTNIGTVKVGVPKN